MRLSEKSYGYQKSQLLITLVDMYPVLCANVIEVSLITVVALVRNPSGRRTIIRNDITSGSVHTTQGGAAVVRSKNVPAQSTKRSSKGRIKSSTVAIYSSVFVLLVSVIAVGYRAPQEASGASSAAPLVNAISTNDQPAVNNVVATDIAASVAEAADLAVAPNVAALAISTKIESDLTALNDSSAISKPAIVSVASETRNVTSYTVKVGDTTQSIADQFGISTQTLKWANNITADSLVVGNNLNILPRDGVLYTVKDGDTIQSIADKYGADAALITSFNDLEISGVTTGLKIVVPDGSLPENERPGFRAPVAVSPTISTGNTSYGSSSGGSFRSGSVGNKYAFGNCTWHVYERRAAIGRPVGSFWGNAKTWDDAARSGGYLVNRTPAVGAILVDEAGYYGHIAIVENILANGDIVLSEMNNAAYGGFNIVNSRTLTPGQAALYQYVH